MKHAGTSGLDQLEPLLARLRKNSGLREKGRGIFYRGAVSFLHFHEDPQGLFADLKIHDEFQRFPVNTAAQRKKLLSETESAVRARLEEAV